MTTGQETLFTINVNNLRFVIFAICPAMHPAMFVLIKFNFFITNYQKVLNLT